jgi:hypothetical protein
MRLALTTLPRKLNVRPGNYEIHLAGKAGFAETAAYAAMFMAMFSVER